MDDANLNEFLDRMVEEGREYQSLIEEVLHKPSVKGGEEINLLSGLIGCFMAAEIQLGFMWHKTEDADNEGSEKLKDILNVITKMHADNLERMKGATESFGPWRGKFPSVVRKEWKL